MVVATNSDTYQKGKVQTDDHLALCHILGHLM